MERFKTMTPDEQTQFIARMKDRGAGHQRVRDGTRRREGAKAPAGKAPAGAKTQPKYGAAQTGETIDALFAPLPTVESQRPRLGLHGQAAQAGAASASGITDGTNTELLSGELQPNMEVVTGVVPAAQRAPPPARARGNPLMPATRRRPGRRPVGDDADRHFRQEPRQDAISSARSRSRRCAA